MTSIAELKKKRASKRRPMKGAASKGKGKYSLTPSEDGTPIRYDNPRGKRRARLTATEEQQRKKAVRLSKKGAKVAEAGGDRSKLDKRSARANEKAVTARGRLNKMDERDTKRIARAKKRMERGLGSGMTDKPTKRPRRGPVRKRNPNAGTATRPGLGSGIKRIARPTKGSSGRIGRGPKKNNRGTTMSRPKRGGTMKKAAVRKQARKARRRVARKKK